MIFATVVGAVASGFSKETPFTDKTWSLTFKRDLSAGLPGLILVTTTLPLEYANAIPVFPFWLALVIILSTLLGDPLSL